MKPKITREYLENKVATTGRKSLTAYEERYWLQFTENKRREKKLSILPRVEARKLTRADRMKQLEDLATFSIEKMLRTEKGVALCNAAKLALDITSREVLVEKEVYKISFSTKGQDQEQDSKRLA